MIRANSPSALLCSTACHVAVITGLAACAWFWSESARQSAPIILIPEDKLVFPGLGGGSMDAVPSLRTVAFSPPRVRALPIHDAATRGVSTEQMRPMTSAKTSSVRKTSVSSVSVQRQRSDRVPVAVPVPQVDGEGMVQELLHGVNCRPGLRGSVADDAATMAFQSRLIALLREAHQMPASVDRMLVARVAFVIAADGRLVGTKIVKTSGETEYDRSVLAAFARVGGMGTVPAGCVGEYVIDFRMAE